MTPERRHEGRRIRKQRRVWARVNRSILDAGKSFQKFGRVVSRAAEQIEGAFK